MKWPTDKSQHSYMKKRQIQNESICIFNENENWMFNKLKDTKYKWSRQSQWGYRLFDFWNHYLGIAIEVDGLEHKKGYDKIRDDYNFIKSGILVLRINNKDEKRAKEIIDFINNTKEDWNQRRQKLNLKLIKMPRGT